MQTWLRKMDKEYFFESCVGNPPYVYIPTFKKDRGNISLAVWPYVLFSMAPAALTFYIIVPAKFLFNRLAGDASVLPKLQNSNHINVLNLFDEIDNPFESTQIRSGLSIILYHNKQEFSPIGIRLINPALTSFVDRVQSKGFKPVTESYRLADIFNTTNINRDFPNVQYIRSRSIPSSMMRKYENVFFTQTKTLKDDVRMLGILSSRKREFRYIKREYVIDRGCLEFYKVIIPRLSEKAKNPLQSSQPIIGDTKILEPGESFTESFGAFGPFSTKEEAIACEKYIKTRFFRALVYLVKPSPHCYIQQFRLVPLMDFTSASFVDWSKDVAQIDEQLFQWFGVTNEEVLLIKRLIS